jgi:signal transduction histidine kinase
MDARAKEGTDNGWLTYCRNSPLDWREVLQPLREQLNDDGLFILELERSVKNGLSLSVRAAANKPPSMQRIPLTDSEVDLVLGASAQVPQYGNVLAPPRCLTPFLPFLEKHDAASAILSSLSIGDIHWGCLLACCKDLRSFSSSELSGFAFAASYISTKLENVHLRAETTLRLSEAMSLQSVSSTLVEERNLDRVLSVIINEAVGLLNASDAVILLLEQDEEWFQVQARAGPDVNDLRSSRMRVKTSLNGLVLRTGCPLLSNNVRGDPRANKERAARLNVDSAVIAPLNIHDKTMGTIAVHNKRDGQFTQTDLEVLRVFANHVAIAIDNARLFRDLLCAKDEVQEKARELQEVLVEVMNIQEKERQRIASAIHDSVISRIVGASYEVEACLRLYQRRENIMERLKLLSQLLKEATERTRASIYDLWPATLEHMGLAPALQELFSRQERRTGITHNLRISGSRCELSPAAKIAAYRIVQEALNNIRQHADATCVDAWLRFKADKMRMIIADNGRGFSVEGVMQSPPRSHFGLVSMRERAFGVGGSLAVESETGMGCRIVLDIPVDGPSAHKRGDRQWE